MGPGKDHPFAKRLRAARKVDLDIRLQDVGDAVGVSHTAIRDWEQGIRLPSRDQCRDLEEALGLPGGELQILAGYIPGSDPKVERTPDGGMVIRLPPDALASSRAKGVSRDWILGLLRQPTPRMAAA